MWRFGKSKSLRRLCREIRILQGFYQLQLVCRLSEAPDLDAKVVTRIYHRLREALSHVAELDEDYFGGRSIHTPTFGIAGPVSCQYK